MNEIATPLSRPTWVRWRIVALLIAYSFLNHFNRSSMPVAANKEIMGEFRISEIQMGTIYSAFLLPYTLFMIPGGWLADRRGPWLALAIVGCGSAIFGALTALPGVLAVSLAVPFFLIIRALMGLCSAPIYPTCGRVISLWVPFPQRSWANGIVNGAAFLGIASAYSLFDYLIGGVGWPVAFLISGVCTGMVALAWLLYATDRPSEHPAVNAAELSLIGGPKMDHPSGKPPALAGWHTLLRNRSLLFLTLSYGAIGYFEYLFQYWIPFYLQHHLKLPEKERALYVSLPSLALIATVPLGGWLSDRLVQSYGYRLGRALVPAAGMTAGAVLLYIGSQTTQPVWSVTWFVLALGAIGSCEGPCWSTAIELGGRQGATAGGIFNMGGNIGGFLAPMVTPWVGIQFGWDWALILSSAICLGGVVLWAWIDPAERVPEPSFR